ncbi:PDR/VanB family oxidoreductase [Mycobacterium intracellulare]|uniref:PDR/VanB family oxidoreductase n=1 Tax=Mycobacterium intracellulare TaxID=1767 RepID=UPI00080B5A46|nr:PDR/VanB family oxidoreductase [Mycobacterium intracellulare]OCB22449.1 ferredoxin [Mycobacterium intracellulare subsp. yongonense]
MSGSHDATEPELVLRVRRREALTAEVVLLELVSADGGPLPDWTPGAHIDLVLPGLIRQYSLCGDPSDRTAYCVAVFLEPESRGGSSYIHASVNEGDEITVRGPRNHFEFKPADRVLFIAGGIGITPLIPMVREAQAAGVDWELHYGGRSRSTMAFLDNLEEACGNSSMTLHPQDEVGLIDLQRLLGTPRSDTVVYCCGPGPLLDAVEAMCESWPKGSLHVERFTAKTIEDRVDTEFELELATSGKTLFIPADRTILDVLDDENVIVASSCRDGTCGTCEAVVLEGIPDHRDSVLSAEEQELNETMMVCVSRSRTPRLVIDL